jgi:NAD-dependent deacetylase
MIFLPDLPRPTGLESYSHYAEQLKPILECLALIFAATAIVKWFAERNNRATDVLLKLEEQFETKCKEGRSLLDWEYDKVKELLCDAVTSGNRRSGSTEDALKKQSAIDDMLRFYVVLCSVRRAKQLPDASLSTSYRFWLAHYYRNDRVELRNYINEFFPTLRSWLLNDCSSWTRFKARFLCRWWRSFFTPEHFWPEKQFERDPKKLYPRATEAKERESHGTNSKSSRRSLESGVLVLTGSGISAESGIPTFRGKDGYWRNLDPAKLATPSAFAKDPGLVWEWYRERRERIRGSEPNAAHHALVKMAMHSPDFLLVTQNVDDLHARAQWEGTGLPSEKIVQIHGDIFITRCLRCCFQSRDIDHDQQGVPQCPSCGGLMRPGVVWFGEELDRRVSARVEDYIARVPANLVLVIGTTAVFDYIRDWAVRASANGGELIEVNPEETPLSQFATQRVREAAAVALPRIVDQLIN